MTTTPFPVTDVDDLAAAVAEFERRLPGWWWIIGSCSVSRDASCAPDRNGCDRALLSQRLFDNGFHCDDLEGSPASSLRDVMEQALAARERAMQEGVA